MRANCHEWRAREEAVGERRAECLPLCDACPLDPRPLARHHRHAARGGAEQHLDLARFADTLGFTRYWLAEHHNLPTIASSAPDIMIGQVAAITKNMRIGSGGVMLPNHAPLMVMERFKVLEALFPGRIDLGLGRAPGTDQITSLALRRRQDTSSEQDDFLDRFQEMILFESNGFPPNHPFSKVAAMPTGVPLPPIWLLGSSDYSAAACRPGRRGIFLRVPLLGFSARDPDAGLSQCSSSRRRGGRRRTRSSASPRSSPTPKPRRIGMAMSADLHFARRAVGQYGPLASPDEAAAYPYTPIDRQRIAHNRKRLIVGSPAQVHERIAALADVTKADEVMITTMVFDHAARKHSYELLAREFGLRAAARQ